MVLQACIPVSPTVFVSNEDGLMLNVHTLVLTVTLFAISAKFKAWVTDAAEGAQHVDASMGTLGQT